MSSPNLVAKIHYIEQSIGIQGYNKTNTYKLPLVSCFHILQAYTILSQNISQQNKVKSSFNCLTPMSIDQSTSALRNQNLMLLFL